MAKNIESIRCLPHLWSSLIPLQHKCLTVTLPEMSLWTESNRYFFLRTRSRWRLRHWHSKPTNCKEKSKSLEHMIKGSFGFMEGSSSWYVITLPGLVAIGILVVEIKCFWFITWPKWPRIQRVVWPNGLKFRIASHHLAKLIGHRSCHSSGTN